MAVPTLVVEDGSGVVGANTFATLAQARAFAFLRGDALTDNDDVLTAYLVKATDLLKSKFYLGTKSFAGEKYLPWPRTGLVVDEVDFPASGAGSVPQAIIDAACQLCIEQNSGIELFPSASGAAVKRERIGPIETEYVSSNRSGRPRMPKVEALLDGWIVRLGRLRTTRV